MSHPGYNDGRRDLLAEAQARIATLEGALREIEDSPTGCVAGHSQIAREALASTPQPSSPLTIVECPECGHAIRVGTPQPSEGEPPMPSERVWTIWRCAKGHIWHGPDDPDASQIECGDCAAEGFPGINWMVPIEVVPLSDLQAAKERAEELKQNYEDWRNAKLGATIVLLDIILVALGDVAREALASTPQPSGPPYGGSASERDRRNREGASQPNEVPLRDSDAVSAEKRRTCQPSEGEIADYEIKWTHEDGTVAWGPEPRDGRLEIPEVVGAKAGVWRHSLMGQPSEGEPHAE